MNRLRRAPLRRLVAACAALVLLGAGAALAAGSLSGPTPPPTPLADAIHAALTAPPVQGVSAHVTFTDALVPGASAESSTPLLTGASGRVWVSNDGRARLELQSDDGDSELIWDGTTLYYLDSPGGTLYEWTPPMRTDGGPSTDSAGGAGASGTSGPAGATGATGGSQHAIPSVADIQKALSHLSMHADLSGAIPDDVAGQAAYSVRLAPQAGRGGLFGAVQLWWDATHGVPLRFAVYAAGNPDPVLELTADDVSYGPIDDSVFAVPTAPHLQVLGRGAQDTSGAAGPAGGPSTGATGDGGSSDRVGFSYSGYGCVSGPNGGPAKPQRVFNFPDAAAADHCPGVADGLLATQLTLPFTVSAPDTLAGMPLDHVRHIRLGDQPAALITYGQGLGGLAVIERAAASAQPAAGAAASGHRSGRAAFAAGQLGVPLPVISVNGQPGTDVATALGTLVSFQRAGVVYVVVGSVDSSTALTAARGL